MRGMPDATMRLELVVDMPQEIEAGILYVSEEYEIACHRCACSCGSLVYSPLGPAEWKFSNDERGPSLRPSIGSWDLPCRSHYWIRNGRVLWAADWSEERVLAGRRQETLRREAIYEGVTSPTLFARLIRSMNRLWERINRW